MKNTLKILLFVFLICGVIGVDEDRLKSVSVMEGDSVTLNIDSSKIQGIILTQWRFGASGAVIAETVQNEVSYPYHTETFKGRLQVDHQTGSLTIKNMRTKHSGLYKLQINHSTGSSHMAFIVTVYDSPPVIDFEMKSVMEGDSLTLHTDVTEPHGDELIVWRFGDDGKLIAKHDIEAKTSTLCDDADERFRDRLQLNDQTGSLTITNTRTSDSGLYTVKISSSSKQTLYKRFNVTAGVSDLSSVGKAGIAVVVLLVVFLAAAAVVFYYRHKIFKQENQMAVIVVEGDDVTPETDAEIQNDDRIMWMFGPQATPIAKRSENRVTFDDSADFNFRDRLKLDEATGSLTITNTRISDSGNYKLRIKSNSGVSYKTLRVIVRENKVKEAETVKMLPSKKDVDGVEDQTRPPASSTVTASNLAHLVSPQTSCPQAVG